MMRPGSILCNWRATPPAEFRATWAVALAVRPTTYFRTVPHVIINTHSNAQIHIQRLTHVYMLYRDLCLHTCTSCTHTQNDWLKPICKFWWCPLVVRDRSTRRPLETVLQLDCVHSLTLSRSHTHTTHWRSSRKALLTRSHKPQLMCRTLAPH